MPLLTRSTETVTATDGRKVWDVLVAPEPAPEPITWGEQPPLKQRLWRGISVPIAAGSVVFVAAIVFAVAAVWMQPHEVQTDLSGDDVVSSLISSDDLTSTEQVTPSQGAASTSLLVHVVGEVRAPGVVELTAGSRAIDAIRAAGGATDEAVLAAVNLARVLVDGEQLIVPNEAQATVAQASAPGASMLEQGKVRLNSADAAMLETLPRVGPALAQRILDWRNANGPFTSIDQLLDISGIGQKTFEQLREQVAL